MINNRNGPGSCSHRLSTRNTITIRQKLTKTKVMNGLCCDEDGVLSAHARRKLGAHRMDEIFEIIARLAGIVCD
jgi:hypothetical protein